MEINVPVGTEVWTGVRRRELIGDVVAAGQQLLVAAGGRGGRGNARFATSINRFPLLAEEGERGERVTLHLELKLLADVGIVGAPNAGKSSLLTAISAARPKVAGYPFTTLDPVLGVVEHRGESFVAVDIPGLIEGAHAGAGLGDEFLRHIERTRVLVHMVDGSVEDPVADYFGTVEEMRLFDKKLVEKPSTAVINKIDLEAVRSVVGDVKRAFEEEGVTPRFVSAVTWEGIPALLDDMIQRLREARLAEEAEGGNGDGEAVPVLRPKPRREPVRVSKDASGYVVASPAAARIAAMVDRDDWNAVTQFYGEMKRMGIVRALEAAGVCPGDTVHIGKVEWEWE